MAKCIGIVRKAHGEHAETTDRSCSIFAACWSTVPKAPIVITAAINEKRINFEFWTVEEAESFWKELGNALTERHTYNIVNGAK
jgi:hypothetical protein